VKEEIIGKRYAKALIQIGKEQGTWEKIGQDLKEFVSLFEENETLKSVLCDPIHDRKKRKAILLGILEKTGTEGVCRHFLCLLIDKERIRYLPAIYLAYKKLEDAIAGRLQAKVISAQRLDDEQVEAIQTSLEKRFDKKIILDRSEEPEILGGVICKVDGMVFDGSLRTRLEVLKETMKGE